MYVQTVHRAHEDMQEDMHATAWFIRQWRADPFRFLPLQFADADDLGLHLESWHCTPSLAWHLLCNQLDLKQDC